MLVSWNYKKNKRKKEKLFHIHDRDLKSLVFKMEERKKKLSHRQFI